MVDEPEEQPQRDAPSLEPPSLFGRKQRKPKAPRAPKATPPPPEPVATPEPTPPPAPQQPAPQPAPTPAREPVARAAPATPVAPVAPVATTRVAAPVEKTPPPAPPVEPVAPKEPREPWLAGRLTGRLAAVVAGLLVGVLLIAATAASLRVCDAVRGTDTCGGSGYLFLFAILLVSVLVGAALLRAAEVPDAGSTALLAVGLIAVFAVVFLVGHLLSWWMVIVIPLVSMGAFALSHWVTTSFTDSD